MELNPQSLPKNYTNICKIGQGSFGEVFKAKYKGNSTDVVAIKRINRQRVTQTLIDSIISEIEILKHLKHKNFVRYIDIEWDSVHVFIITELCEGGDLEKFLHEHGSISEFVSFKFLIQIRDAFEYLRSKNISHLDLKPSNILLIKSRTDDDFIVKISDFGTSRYISPGSSFSDIRGSYLYMSPEILLKQTYNEKADLWSIGIILYKCLFSKLPFNPSTYVEILYSLQSPNFCVKFPNTPRISLQCKHLLLALLQRDPKERISFDSFFNFPLLHPLLLQHFTFATEALDLYFLSKSENSFQNYEKALEFCTESLACFQIILKQTPSFPMNINFYEYYKKCVKLHKSIEQCLYKNDQPFLQKVDNLEQNSRSSSHVKNAQMLLQVADSYLKRENYRKAESFYTLVLESLFKLVANDASLKEPLKYSIKHALDQVEITKKKVNEINEESKNLFIPASSHNRHHTSCKTQ